MNENLPSVEKLTEASLAGLLPADEKIPVIPDRMYFRIGDVAEIAGVQPYVLRFWEKEFDFFQLGLFNFCLHKNLLHFKAHFRI